MSLIKGQGAGEVSTGFYSNLLDQSLKFNDDNNPFLTRTPSTSNQRTWTWSAWIKRGNLGSGQGIFGTDSNSTTNFFLVQWTSNDTLFIQSFVSSSETIRLGTTRVFRDPSAWYHIVIAVDTTQATASNRLKLYVNGVQETDFSSGNATYPNSQNLDTLINNSSYPLLLGAVDVSGTPDALDGYLAEINFIDGTALTADSFGETVQGIWIPKDTSGLTFGTNGFHLTFKDDVVSEGFNTVTYTGTQATQSISGVGFSPGLVWLKGRSTNQEHNLFDVLRSDSDGPRRLYSSLTVAEESTVYSGTTNVSSLDADGFTMGNGTSINESNQTFVGWCWEAGGTPTADNSAGAGATPTSGSVKIDGSNLGSALGGSIAATRLSANTTKGFSVVTFTSNGNDNQTVAHGLGAVPKWILVKNRSATGAWVVGLTHTGFDWDDNYYQLSDTGAKRTDGSGTVFGADPTSTLFTFGSSFGSNGTNLVAYCWAEISGYSKFSSYSGNGSSTGPTVTTGFRPAMVIAKRTDSSISWVIFDNTRDPANPVFHRLNPNTNSSEGTNVNLCNFTDTGFEITTSDGIINASGGTYIYMAFADTREAAFFKDVSSNGNHFTPVNLDYRDSVPDVPTNNFATFNPLDAYAGATTFSEGNLKGVTTSGGLGRQTSTIRPASGKWYAEFYVSDSTRFAVGIENGQRTNSAQGGNDANSIIASYNGQYYYNGGGGSYMSSLSNGNIVQVAMDVDNKLVFIGINNTWQNSATASEIVAATATNSLGAKASATAATLFQGDMGIFTEDNSGSGAMSSIANFGQDSSFAGLYATANSNADGNGHGSFAYAPPSGFLALCSQNLPDVDIIDGTENFNTVLYTGNAGSNHAISGVGFSPDWLWIKNRADTYSHMIYDTVRGAGKYISSDVTNAEATGSHMNSFDSDGFTVSAASSNRTNAAQTYVAWNWLAATAFSNDASATGVGTINSEGQINTTAGFAILKWAGTGSNGTIAHGLNAAPELIIVKNRGETDEWPVLETVANGATHYLRLNANYASTSTSVMWNNTAPTSSVFSVGTYEYVNASGENYISYIFHSVEGYSKVGSYVGNGNADGAFVHTGFRPAWIIIKATDSTQTWWMHDNKRDVDNVVEHNLGANLSSAEDDDYPVIDFLSNGFKCRSTDTSHNGNGNVIVYLAFAESPAKFSNAR